MVVKSERRTLFLDFASGIGFYSLPMLFRAAAGFLTIPVYTRFLTPADYGTLELLDLTSFLVSVLIGTNFGQAVFYYYAAGKTEAERGRAISTVFFGSMLVATFVGIVGTILAPAFSKAIFGTGDYTVYVRLLFLTPTVAFPAEVGLCCIRVLNRARLYAIVSITRLVTGVAVNIFLLASYHLGFAAMLWGSFVVTAGVALYVGWFCAPWFRYGGDRRLFIAMLRYSWPLNLSALAMLILDLGDRYVLKGTVTLSELGIYGLAYKVGMIVGTVSLVFNQFWKPRMFTLIREPSGDRIYVRVFTYYTFALTCVCVGLTVVLCPLLQLVVGRDFISVGTYIPSIAVIYLARLMGDYLRNALYLNKRTVKDAQITWLGCTVCVVAYLTLIPWLKLWGAIIATGSSFGIMLLVSFWQAQQVKHFHFEMRRLAMIVGTGVVLISLFVWIRPADMFPSLVLGLALAVLYPVTLLGLQALEPDEVLVLRQGLTRFRERFTALGKRPE
jgi:O-antigen/teichoic acid export membrane protein